ncbi:helix-turn-helix domain-containing protein [Streptomyces sp. NPDC048644]|uniref:helix-turn-helix domain-containing protein n=1 Tax=Streptomyces sp. NPDC048644 TaxID=3365582 RepID=UPI0037143C8C
MNHEALRELLRAKRRSIWPQHAGLAPRPKPGLYQDEVAALLHVSVQTYRRLEQGQLRIPAIDFLAHVARLLNFSEVEWADLCRYARDCDPPHPIRSNSGQEVPAEWGEFISGIPHPAWVTDQSWNVLAYNQAWAAVFESGTPPANHMAWMLLDPAARTDTLLDWDTYWLPNVLVELRAACDALKDDPKLREINHAVRNDPLVGPRYASLPRAHTSTDGDHRPLRHHQLGDVWVTLLSSMPSDSPRARFGGLIMQPSRPSGQRRTLKAPRHHAPHSAISAP